MTSWKFIIITCVVTTNCSYFEAEYMMAISSAFQECLLMVEWFKEGVLTGFSKDCLIHRPSKSWQNILIVSRTRTKLIDVRNVLHI